LTQTSLLSHILALAITTKPAFKVQDLPEDLTFISTFITLIVSALDLAELTSPATPKIISMVSVAILTSAPAFTTPMVFAPALTELTLLSTPKIAPALSPATYILTKPQV
jgi:hypothetical protein